ncbi:MAG: membrane dipeptidase [Lachnospiraceae bacterium]|nr:membrane dipeptidase [Lachnospiraceae bacterium]
MKVVDMHCDTISHIAEARKAGEELISLRENSLHLDLMKMKKADYLLQNFAMFVSLKDHENPLEWCQYMIDTYYQELEKNKDLIAPIFSYSDICRNEEEGKISALLTIEEGGTAKGELANLRNFYRLGVRMITLTWNYKNEIGFPNRDALNPWLDERMPNTKDGLTSFGKEFVEEMECLHMIPDVSHLSDAGFYDVAAIAKKPFVASHSNARSIWPHPRNLTDDMIRVLAEHGGVMGINYEPSFIGEGKAKLAAIVNHIRHIADVGGINCIGLGSDFDGITTNEELKDGSYLPCLEDALYRAGFGCEEIAAIFYKNVLRVYKEVL